MTRDTIFVCHSFYSSRVATVSDSQLASSQHMINTKSYEPQYSKYIQIPVLHTGSIVFNHKHQAIKSNFTQCIQGEINKQFFKKTKLFTL